MYVVLQYLFFYLVLLSVVIIRYLLANLCCQDVHICSKSDLCKPDKGLCELQKKKKRRRRRFLSLSLKSVSTACLKHSRENKFIGAYTIELPTIVQN